MTSCMRSRIAGHIEAARIHPIQRTEGETTHRQGLQILSGEGCLSWRLLGVQACVDTG